MLGRILRLTAAGAVVAASAVAIGGCGEIANTIKPPPDTANHLTVALPTAPSATYIGIYEAQALGYFKQADLDVQLQAPSSGVTDTLTPLFDYKLSVAVASEPSLMLARNRSEALVGVGALVHGPLKTVKAITVKTPAGSGKHKRARTTVRYQASNDVAVLPTSLQHRTLPAYDGLVFAVRKGTIVNHAEIIRRFVQAVARGYEAARSNPTAATQTLISTVPSLAKTRALQLTTIKMMIPSFFPAGDKIWGWQYASQWNAFGTWLTRLHMITNPNATPDASTNELLAGQGV